MDVLKGAVAASLAVLLWGFVFWWSELPFVALNSIEENDQVETVSFLQKRFPESGVYMIPRPEDYLTKATDPREVSAMTIHVLASEDMRPLPLMALIGFARIFLATLIVGLLLKLAMYALGSRYLSRVWFVVFIALALIIYRDLADPIWWYFPWAWNLVKAFYDLIAWTIVAFILAGFIRTPHQTQAK